MVKSFNALKEVLSRANTPATAQSVKDLTSAIERLHGSYANVYNSYSRTYVMMQELGTKEDGTVVDFTDEARASIANTALEDKKREVRDNSAVVQGLKKFLNNNPLKSVSVIIDTVSQQPAIAKIARSGAAQDPDSLTALFYNSIFAFYRTELTGLTTTNDVPNWNKAMDNVLVKGHIRLGSEVTRPRVAPFPYGDDTVYSGKHCGLLVPYWSSYAPASATDDSMEPQVGMLWVEAALYTDAADTKKSYLLVDVIKIGRQEGTVKNYRSIEDLLNDDITYENRLFFHSGVITSITSRNNCQLYWETTESGLHLKLVDQDGHVIPTLTVKNDVFARSLLYGVNESIMRDEASVFTDMSGIGFFGDSIRDSLIVTRNAIRADCNKYNFPLDNSQWRASSTGFKAACLLSLLGTFVEERFTCDTYPLPMKDGSWLPDGTRTEQPLSSNMFGSYLTGGYWFFNPQAWAKFSGGTLPAYCDLLPMFTRSEIASVFSDAYALFVGATRYGDILREYYEQSTVTDSQRKSVTSNVSVGDIVSQSLDYGNEDEILSAIESL